MKYKLDIKWLPETTNETDNYIVNGIETNEKVYKAFENYHNNLTNDDSLVRLEDMEKVIKVVFDEKIHNTFKDIIIDLLYDAIRIRVDQFYLYTEDQYPDNIEHLLELIEYSKILNKR